MKDNDKVTLTIDQLKKLVKESYENPNGVIDNIFDQMTILEELADVVQEAYKSAKIVANNSDINARESVYSNYESNIQRILNYTEQVEKFDVIAL